MVASNPSPPPRLSRCPATGLTVEQRPEWQSIHLTDQYAISFQVIGDGILHSTPVGRSSAAGVSRLFEQRRVVLEQAGLADRPHCEIRCYDHVSLRQSRPGRARFIAELTREVDRGQLQGLWGYGGHPLFRWILSATRALVSRPQAPLAYVADYAAAAREAHTWLTRQKTRPRDAPTQDAPGTPWRYARAGYRVSFEIEDDCILVQRAAGHMRNEHVTPYFALLERVLHESGCADRLGLLQVCDDAELQHIEWRALVQYYRKIMALHRRLGCHGVVIASDSRPVVAATRLGTHMFPFPFLVEANRELAIERAHALRAQSTAPLPTAPLSATASGADGEEGARGAAPPEADGEEGARGAAPPPAVAAKPTNAEGAPAPVVSRQTLDEQIQRLVRYAGTINWQQPGLSEPPEDPQDPLAPLYALLTVLKHDFDAILREREQMQDQVLQAAKLAALATLTAGVAHELNSPLTAVLGYANVLQEQSSDPMVHQAAERITRCGGRMRDIIEQLTVFTRTGDTPRIGPLDINDSIRSASVLLEAALRKRDPTVELRLTLASGLPPVTCDPGHLQSVIHHLVLNAHAACASAETAQAAQEITPTAAETTPTAAETTPTAAETTPTAAETTPTAEIGKRPPQRADTTPSVIELSTEVTADGVRIQCRDPGCGMTPEVRRRAFDPFFTTQDVGEGTGLGLFVCHRLVTDHGGTLRLDSTVGEGTTVTIDFPAAESSPP